MTAAGTIWRSAVVVLAAGIALAACGGGGYGAGSPSSPPASSPPAIDSFTAAASSVFVGERTELTAVFSGDSASIDGIGPVESGRPVATPPLARPTTFKLTVRAAQQQVEARVTVAASYRDRFRELAPSPVARTQHVAMALVDGGALVMGGNTSESPHVPDADTSQRFDPATETLVAGPQLAFTAMAESTTPVQLDGGAFLLVGGGVNSFITLRVNPTIASQVFDATTGRFGRVGDLGFAHLAGATATPLGDGGVLVAGGLSQPAAERYDPASGRWALAGAMATARRGHTATRLADGRVLFVGGFTCCDATGELVAGTAEIYDPVAGGFQPTGSLATARAFHKATLLPDGRVLVTGGLVGGSAETTASAEIYDPSTGRFGPGGAMQVGRFFHSAILLTDGRVLVLGGESASAATEIFEPTGSRWIPGPTLQPAWGASAVTLLANGRVLVVGGENAGGFPVSTVMLFE